MDVVVVHGYTAKGKHMSVFLNVWKIQSKTVAV